MQEMVIKVKDKKKVVFLEKLLVQGEELFTLNVKHF